MVQTPMPSVQSISTPDFSGAMQRAGTMLGTGAGGQPPRQRGNSNNPTMPGDLPAMPGMENTLLRPQAMGLPGSVPISFPQGIDLNNMVTFAQTPAGQALIASIIKAVGQPQTQPMGNRGPPPGRGYNKPGFNGRANPRAMRNRTTLTG